MSRKEVLDLSPTFLPLVADLLKTCLKPDPRTETRYNKGKGKGKVKGKAGIAVHGTLFHSYGVSLVICVGYLL